MSYDAYGAICDAAKKKWLRLPAPALAVLYQFAWAADKTDCTAYLSIPKLALMTGLDERTVRAKIDDLERMGLLLNTGRLYRNCPIRQVCLSAMPDPSTASEPTPPPSNLGGVIEDRPPTNMGGVIDASASRVTTTRAPRVPDASSTPDILAERPLTSLHLTPDILASDPSQTCTPNQYESGLNQENMNLLNAPRVQLSRTSSTRDRDEANFAKVEASNGNDDPDDPYHEGIGDLVRALKALRLQDDAGLITVARQMHHAGMTPDDVSEAYRQTVTQHDNAVFGLKAMMPALGRLYKTRPRVDNAKGATP